MKEVHWHLGFFLRFAISLLARANQQTAKLHVKVSVAALLLELPRWQNNSCSNGVRPQHVIYGSSLWRHFWRVVSGDCCCAEILQSEVVPVLLAALACT